MKKLISAIVIGSMLMFTGCSAKDTVKSVILKAYNVTCSAETVIQNASTSTVVSVAQLLDTPLGLLGTALIYIDGKVTDQKIKDVIQKAIPIVAQVKAALKDVTPEKVDATKATVIAGLENMKSTLKVIGEYFKVEFPTVMIAANVDPLKQLKNASDELSALLK
jgi:hypothetical protein